MFDIFSKVPAKCLARSRCVSKLWCQYIDDRYLMTVYAERVLEEPIPILYHFHERITSSLCFHGLESLESRDAYLIDFLVPKEGPFLEFLQRKPLSRSSIVRIKVRGSCNGLMCLSQDEDDIVTSLVVVHPLKKECYELPPLPMRDLNLVRKNLCTMVHVFGTNSWREIPQVPPYCITDGAVFANGRLHWLVSHIDNKTEDAGRPVIWFDVEKEEFGLIDHPKRMCDLWINSRFSNDYLVDLNGEVGYVCARTME
nr:hypothetical protein [Tanacetum cinerariifolium]